MWWIRTELLFNFIISLLLYFVLDFHCFSYLEAWLWKFCPYFLTRPSYLTKSYFASLFQHFVVFDLYWSERNCGGHWFLSLTLIITLHIYDTHNFFKSLWNHILSKTEAKLNLQIGIIPRIFFLRIFLTFVLFWSQFLE